MTEKTASALDFLKVPHKQSDSLYEVLAKEASAAYIDNNVAPNETIAKVASARGLNHDQIHRVVELANHDINRNMSKSADDQLFTFPVATVDGVLQAMGIKTAGTIEIDGEEFAPVQDDEIEKAAGLIDWGVYDQLDGIPDYADVIKSRRFDQKLASEVSEKLEEPGHFKLADAPKGYQKNELEYLEKRASADLEYAHQDLEVSLSGLRTEWEKVAESVSDQVQFMSAATCVLGYPSMKKLAERFGDDAIKAAMKVDPDEVNKVAEYVDSNHPVVESMLFVKEKLAALGKAAEGAQEVLKVTSQYKEAEKREKWASVFPERPKRMSLVLDALR